MLTDLVIENFQAVRDARLRLGQLTVITGPTGSGKSAVIRALRLAAFNRRGTSFIRHGAKACKAGFGDQDHGWFLAVERAGKSSDSYKLSRFDPEHPDDPPTWLYTKLAGEAPQDILDAHGLTELNFAGQFDRPFLLDSSGAEVARTLGELTNVVLVLEAARAAAIRRQRAAAAAKRDEELAASLAEQVQQYAGLPAQRASQDRAEHILQQVRDITVRRDRLDVLLTAAELHQVRREISEQHAQAAAPPSLERVGALADQRDRLRALISEAEDARRGSGGYEELADYASQLAVQEDRAHRAIHDALAEAGQCPTCGYPVPR